MPRRPRLQLPGYPLHVTQRGVNRCAIFVDNIDRHHFYELLCEAMAEHSIGVHAYVFMGNHVHLLLTPPEREALSLAMRNVGQCYVQAFNKRHRRSGTLWQGRFKSCLVDTERYLMTVYRYIELNPVRASMVALPEQYRWSSVHANLGLFEDRLIKPTRSSLRKTVIRRRARQPTGPGCVRASARRNCSASVRTSNKSARWANPSSRP